uniref:Uncharacterized protein n=2 Tax=Ditylum brightwellii TaxID=49249 RepID=A0A7S4UXM4_9STRA|mmetsp:Transcript_68701/g.102118  ORF Transcript_68701/g.102118 Transcript_68701/m.102118 type:complete len:379 (-) Transcript_68701:276-1412(-)
MTTDNDEGHYELSDYEKQRLERIAKNHKYLESIGLGDAKQKMRDMTKKTKKNLRRQQLLPQVKPGDERRSKRILRSADSLVMLSYNDEDERVVTQDDDYDFEQDDDEDNVYATTPSRQFRSRKYGLINREDWEISEEDKKELEKDMDDNYLGKFKEFLVFHNKISEQNVRNVMRQVRKLARGEGIRYESPRYGWPENCYFMKGTLVTPLSDIVDLMEKGQECEDKWGRDHGNGWLISHPLKKLLLFQQFVLNNPDFLAAKCKLKEYYDMDDDGNDDIIPIVSPEKSTGGEDIKQEDAASPKTVVKTEPKSSKKKKSPKKGENIKQEDAASPKTVVKTEPTSSKKRKAPEKNDAPQKKKSKTYAKPERRSSRIRKTQSS